VIDACDPCLRRTDLLVALAGFIDVEWKRTDRARAVLALPDRDLLALDPRGQVGRRYEAFDPAAARARIDSAGMHAACRCADGYPDSLRCLPDPPAVLHALGRLGPVATGPEGAVAMVGARRPTGYGLEVARALARGIGVARLSLVSGMAMGIDSASHEGALEGGGHTVAVLAGAADVPYPSHKRALHARILTTGGAVVSEWPPGAGAHRWSFVARNRIIAALASITVVVEGTIRSGSLTTAGFAAEAGRGVAAVPGPITSRLSSGPNALIADGADLIAEPGDVLDLMLGPGGRELLAAARAPALPAPLAALLRALEGGRDTPAALVTRTRGVEEVLRGLTELELHGLVRRRFDGRYVRVP
jgi:DNA processing protein